MAIKLVVPALAAISNWDVQHTNDNPPDKKSRKFAHIHYKTTYHFISKGAAGPSHKAGMAAKQQRTDK